MITVAHFVTPYLFATGSWIHTQIARARSTRPIVITRQLENPSAFPFEPIHLIGRGLPFSMRVRGRLRYLAGDLDPPLYLPTLRSEHVDLIHAHLGWEGARAVTVARAARLPLVTSFYGRDAGRLPRYPWWRLFYRRLFREGEAFLVEGPALGRKLEELGCPEEKIRVIHLGIDLDKIPFSERSMPPDGRVEILVSSSLRPKKGVPAAVAAFAEVAARFPAARLRILGDGPERGKVVRMIHHLGLGSRVSLEGYVTYPQHLAALAEAHIFLAPSRTAPDGDTEGGAPVSLLEAQASGLPIVSTNHADIPEAVEAGASGVLSPEFDDEALARNLLWMIEHSDQWPAMGRRGRDRMERLFNAARQVETTARFYQTLVGR